MPPPLRSPATRKHCSLAAQGRVERFRPALSASLETSARSVDVLAFSSGLLLCSRANRQFEYAMANFAKGCLDAGFGAACCGRQSVSGVSRTRPRLGLMILAKHVQTRRPGRIGLGTRARRRILRCIHRISPPLFSPYREAFDQYSYHDTGSPTTTGTVSLTSTVKRATRGAFPRRSSGAKKVSRTSW